MRNFDSFAVVDWSSGNDTGPRPRKDAIWMGLVRQGQEEEPVYLRNRREAETQIANLIEAERQAGRSIMIGFDFPFGYPAGFAECLTGHASPFAVWEWLDTHLNDEPTGNNRFDLAAKINQCFPGVGPFWFNGLKRDIPDLPRKDTRRDHGMPDRRLCERQTQGAFTCWQMGGAGAVGGQVLTGLPVLHRLRQRFAQDVSVWPFQPLDTPVAFVEIWPGLINPAVKQAEAGGGIRDMYQVQLLSRALSCLSFGDLRTILNVDAPEEGWIMGLGHEGKLNAAAQLQPPPLRDDCFALPAGVDWVPVDDALASLRTGLRSVVATETVPLAKALGRVLSNDVVALRSNPPHANTAVDGFGFAHETLTQGDQILPLVQGRAAAGQPHPKPVPPGYAIRILTGAALPGGVDTVILQEDVNQSGAQIAFRAGLKKGANTRKAGEDVTAGDTILQACRKITPADLALAAATGLAALQVHKPLKVGIVSTGDELIEAGETPRQSQIFDANRPMLAGLVHQFGYEPHDFGRLPDDRPSIAAALNRASDEVDVILTSGGASAGEEDHVSALLNETGTMQTWRIAVKPGRPLALGLWRGTPVFGLPGNPVAALVCTLIFARPAMSVLAGETWRDPLGFDVPAAFEKIKKPGRREYLRARIRDGRVEIFKSEGSGRISGLSWAEGLVELPDGAASIKPGDPVRYLPFSSFL